jgi:hypothetical protein
MLPCSTENVDDVTFSSGEYKELPLLPLGLLDDVSRGTKVVGLFASKAEFPSTNILCSS